MPRPHLRRPERHARPERPRRPAPVKRAVVAAVEVEGGVRLEAASRETVVLRPGQRLRLVCAYRLRSSTSHTETCDIRLGVTPGAGGPARHRDVRETLHAGWAEGVLELDVRFVAPGRRTVHWSAAVDHEVRHWGGGQVLRVEREQLEGTLDVLVK